MNELLIIRDDQKKKNVLAHHGILGMKWGVRRYQNEDGTLTEAGKRRYETNAKRVVDDINKGDLFINTRGTPSTKAGKSKKYIRNTAKKNKDFMSANKEVFKHPSSKNAKQEYVKQAENVVDQILGDHKNDKVKWSGYNDASEFLLSQFFDIKIKDL